MDSCSEGFFHHLSEFFEIDFSKIAVSFPLLDDSATIVFGESPAFKNLLDFID